MPQGLRCLRLGPGPRTRLAETIRRCREPRLRPECDRRSGGTRRCPDRRMAPQSPHLAGLPVADAAVAAKEHVRSMARGTSPWQWSVLHYMPVSRTGPWKIKTGRPASRRKSRKKSSNCSTWVRRRGKNQGAWVRGQGRLVRVGNIGTRPDWPGLCRDQGRSQRRYAAWSEIGLRVGWDCPQARCPEF
jgi:hypothetical protein